MGSAPLYPFREWAERNGYSSGDFSIFDVDLCAAAAPDGKGKLECANRAVSVMVSAGAARFLLVGHSAGADAVIVAGDRMTDKGRIAGIALLDPTLTATLENDIPGQTQTNLQSMADNLPQPKFLGDTLAAGDQINVFINGAEEKEYPKLSHADLALTEYPVTDMVNAFGWSEMR
jgi:pimeloyl-ACP methyl ester carboxylesterase